MSKIDDATQALINEKLAEQLEELNQQHETEINGLRTKNSNLIAENKRLKAGAGVSPEDVARMDTLETENETLKRDNTKLANDLKKANSNLETATRERDEEKTFAEQTVIRNDLTRDLIAHNVNPDLLPGALALLERDASIKVEGKDRKAVFGEKSSGDFIKEWAEKSGKSFTVAPVNGGGGSHKDIPGGGATKKYSELTEGELTNLHNTNKPEFDRLLAEHNASVKT